MQRERLTIKELVTPAEERLTAKEVVMSIANELELDSQDVRFLVSCLQLNKYAEFVEAICFYAKTLQDAHMCQQLEREQDEACRVASIEWLKCDEEKIQ